MKKCVVDFFIRFVLKWLATVREFSKALTWFTNWIGKQLFGCFFIIGRIRLTKMISSSGKICKYFLLAFNSFFTSLKDLILLITFSNSTSAELQVNLFQKLSFLNHLSTIWWEILHWIPRKIQVHNMLNTNIVLNVKTKTIFVHSVFWTCIFLGIQWTISHHIVG